mgnify:CR=1 FL=1
MMDYYGDFPGPTKENAKKQIVDNVKRKINNDLKHITEDIIIDIVDKTIEKQFPNEKTIGSVSGWSVFFYNDLTKDSIEELKKENIRLEECKKKLCAGTIALQGLVNKDILNEIIIKMR